MVKILGIDFGIKVFAVCSDGKFFSLEPPKKIAEAAKALALLCDHASGYDLVIIEGLKGSDLTAHNIRWFKSSMKRNYPRVRIKRAEHNFPSSRLCNECTSVDTVSVNRRMECRACGHVDNRDLNAAKNLRDWGVAYSSRKEATSVADGF